MFKNLSKGLSIYLLILAAAFALMALSNSTITLAQDDEVTYCWDTQELSIDCTPRIGTFKDYLDDKLPPVDETYDTRDNYIQRLYDDMIAGCLERPGGGGGSANSCTTGSTRTVYGHYLYSHLSRDSLLINGQESELLIMLWADIKVNEWGNQERYDQDDLPPTAGSYYVYRPTVEPQPPQEDRDPPPRSPDTPPASLPSESSYRNTHQDNQQGWDDNEADQYRYDGDGYYRRKQQGDGSFKCYFNGYDGSLANLGEC